MSGCTLLKDYTYPATIIVFTWIGNSSNALLLSNSKGVFPNETTTLAPLGFYSK